MARGWTERRIGAPATLKADDLNVENAAAARQINGSMDQHNLPLASMDAAKLVAGVPAGSARSTYLAANSYHRSVLPPDGLDDPLLDIDPEGGTIGGGWNSLATLLEDDSGVVCEFTGREGMIHGHALVDFERRLSYSRQTPDAGPALNPAHGDGNRLQFSVWLNSILVADSGPIPPRRLTVDLPFSYPAPAGPVRIEIKFKAITVFQVASGYENDAGTEWAYVAPAVRYPHILFHAAAIYARNQYR